MRDTDRRKSDANTSKGYLRAALSVLCLILFLDNHGDVVDIIDKDDIVAVWYVDEVVVAHLSKEQIAVLRSPMEDVNVFPLFSSIWIYNRYLHVYTEKLSNYNTYSRENKPFLCNSR